MVVVADAFYPRACSLPDDAVGHHRPAKGHPDGPADPHAYSDGHGNSYTYPHTYSDGHCNGHTNRHTHTDCSAGGNASRRALSGLIDSPAGERSWLEVRPPATGGESCFHLTKHFVSLLTPHGQSGYP